MPSFHCVHKKRGCFAARWGVGSFSFWVRACSIATGKRKRTTQKKKINYLLLETHRDTQWRDQQLFSAGGVDPKPASTAAWHGVHFSVSKTHSVHKTQPPRAIDQDK